MNKYDYETFEQACQRIVYEKYGVKLPLWFFVKYNNVPEAIKGAEEKIKER